jgi:hypothetical protein
MVTVDVMVRRRGGYGTDSTSSNRGWVRARVEELRRRGLTVVVVDRLGREVSP